MKLLRFVRDMPKHERSKANYLESLQSQVDSVSGAGLSDSEAEEDDFRRSRVEDLLAMDNYD